MGIPDIVAALVLGIVFIGAAIFNWDAIDDEFDEFKWLIVTIRFGVVLALLFATFHFAVKYW